MKRSELRSEINRLLLIVAGVVVVAAIGFAVYSASREMDEVRSYGAEAGKRQADLIEEAGQLTR